MKKINLFHFIVEVPNIHCPVYLTATVRLLYCVVQIPDNPNPKAVFISLEHVK